MGSQTWKTLLSFASIWYELINKGHSKYHKGDSLVVMTETKALDNSDAIKDFAVDPKKAVQ